MSPAIDRRGTLLSVALIAVTGLTLLSQGWRRWTHVIIDYGRELYVPWRLSAGEVLYRDLAYFNGPLSPYLNSLVFRLFGASYTTLVLFNIALLAFCTTLLYRLLGRLTDRLTATVGCVVFLVIFGLADLTGFGNYNFVTPYSHEMTHATLLSLAVFILLGSCLVHPSRFRLVALGALLGLLFLTKAEFFLAAGVAVTAGFACMRMGTREGPSPCPSEAVDRQGDVKATPIWMVSGLILPPLSAWLLLVMAMSPTKALQGTLGSWPYVFLDELTELLFYQKGLGSDAPGENLRKMMTWLGIHACLFGPVLLAARYLPPASRRRWWVTLAAGSWTGGLLVLVAPRFDFTDLPRPLPIVLIAAITIAGVPLLRHQAARGLEAKTSIFLAYEVFALVLLAKMALHPRFQNYGFALALPATMVIVVLLLHRIPGWIDGGGGNGPTFRVAALVFLLLTALAFFWPSVLVYRTKNLQYGHGADMYRVQDRYVVMQQLLDRLPSLVGPDETLLALPEGAMLNFQTRRRNPTPHFNFMPPELIMFGEENIIEALDRNPPDVIVLIKRRTIEYGFESIGDGYGETLMRWVGDRYTIVETVEDPALWGQNFGKALILRRVQE